MGKYRRIIGTTRVFIEREEKQLGRKLPTDFVNWIMENNTRSLGGLTIHPIRDDRNLRQSWDSIAKVYEKWSNNDSIPEQVRNSKIPFADYGTGDVFCFDSSPDAENSAIFLWPHEHDDTLKFVNCFSEFIDIVEANLLDDEVCFISSTLLSIEARAGHFLDRFLEVEQIWALEENNLLLMSEDRLLLWAYEEDAKCYARRFSPDSEATVISRDNFLEILNRQDVIESGLGIEANQTNHVSISVADILRNLKI